MTDRPAEPDRAPQRRQWSLGHLLYLTALVGISIAVCGWFGIVAIVGLTVSWMYVYARHENSMEVAAGICAFAILASYWILAYQFMVEPPANGEPTTLWTVIDCFTKPVLFLLIAVSPAAWMHRRVKAKW